MKKIFLAIFLLVIGIMVWYLFLKKYDYQFNTTAKNTPGAVFSEISEWKKFTAPTSPDDIELIRKIPFKTIVQKVQVDSNSFIEMNWDIEQVNDSTTALKVRVRSNRNSLNNRWNILNPFQRSRYIDTVKNKLSAFQYKLRNQKLSYNVKVEDEVKSSPDSKCVCSSSRSIPVSGKATEMVNKIQYLENFVLDRNIKLSGFPFVEITKWDRERDLIDFDFCFPVSETNGLKGTSQIKIKNFNSSPSLKAIFRGNYRLSHIAWFELLYSAEERGVNTTGLPLEVFHNNPQNEENPINWIAEIYLPMEK